MIKKDSRGNQIWEATSKIAAIRYTIPHIPVRIAQADLYNLALPNPIDSFDFGVAPIASAKISIKGRENNNDPR